jgi:site-specific DNA-methyltransferase (adenine-specific)
MIYHETEHGILYCGDCLYIMSNMLGMDINLCLTDPPYGIGESNKKNLSRGKFAKPTNYGDYDWDLSIPDKRIFDLMLKISKNQIIFGGNYFVEYLKNSSCWLVWDKDNGKSDFADCELAWTSFKSAVRIFKYRWHGMLQGNMKQKETRYHPTQKPVPLFEWCLTNYSKQNDTVLDPFAGSGTTAIACIRLGRKYILIEKEEKYCEIAVRRIESELDQTTIDL